MQEEKKVEYASDWKELGNQQFKDEKFEEAVKSYTKAIEIDSSVSIYFSNRSRAYKAINLLDEALKDAL